MTIAVMDPKYGVEIVLDSRRERQKAVMKSLRDLIGENPERFVTKEEIVRVLAKTSAGSRKTTYQAINELEQLGRISVERVNRQLHRISINPKSELNVIDDLKDAFYSLIEDAVPLFRKLSVTAEIDIVSDEAISLNHASGSLATLFEHLLSVYMLFLLFEWPRRVRDKRTRSKLYEVAFQSIKDIQFKLEEAFGIGRLQDLEKGEIISDLFIMRSSKLYSTIINLEYVGLGEQGKILLDILWKLSSPFIADALFEMHGRHETWKKKHRKSIKHVAEDWRSLVRYYVDNLPPEKKNWARSITDEY